MNKKKKKKKNAGLFKVKRPPETLIEQKPIKAITYFKNQVIFLDI